MISKMMLIKKKMLIKPKIFYIKKSWLVSTEKKNKELINYYEYFVYKQRGFNVIPPHTYIKITYNIISAINILRNSDL